ncbi:Uncharacterised protein [Neisseria meningitidis]|nr:Uncharacterised protein [Neisseria meningitidis]CWS69382.1 Uncharacterised protein [Neisseria meningitidis]SUA39471.1 Uncharacterised protein [Neisseria meningitidis]
MPLLLMKFLLLIKLFFLEKDLDGHRHIPNVFLWFASLRTTDFVTPQNSIRQRENMRLRQWVQTGFLV